jgi:hypothetical protein
MPEECNMYIGDGQMQIIDQAVDMEMKQSVSQLNSLKACPTSRIDRYCVIASTTVTSSERCEAKKHYSTSASFI